MRLGDLLGVEARLGTSQLALLARQGRLPALPVDVTVIEEITRLARVFVAEGVEKIRLTGGEPLGRRNIMKLVEVVHTINTLPGCTPSPGSTVRAINTPSTGAAMRL